MEICFGNGVSATALVLLALMCWSSTVTTAFVVPNDVMSTPTTSVARSTKKSDDRTVPLFSTTDGQSDESSNMLAVRSFLSNNYPKFYTVLQLNDEVWKAIGEDDAEKGKIGFTIFALSDTAMQQLGEKKNTQLMDPRNLEATRKIGGYHVISQTVTAEQLYNSGGVVTTSGAIPVERSMTGGMFGMGGQEDGGVLINKARATQTWQVGTGLIHEVDGMVCPSIMWRYMDQLRIPGSR